MKKTISIILIILTVLSFLTVGCTNANNTATTDGENTLTETSYKTEEETQPPVTTPVKITPTAAPKTEVKAVSRWNGVSVSKTFKKGIGTKSSPYEISDCADLAKIANDVTNGTRYKGKYFSLTSDLDLCYKEWKPIGSYENPFEGIFIGNGHTISGLNVTKGHETETNGKKRLCAGLFGAVDSAQISGVFLTGVSVDISDAKRCDYYFAAALVGFMFCNGDSSISNCYVQGKVKATQKDSLTYVSAFVGYMRVAEHGSAEMTENQCNAKLDYGYGTNCFFTGGMCAGYIDCKGSVDISDFCARGEYLHISINNNMGAANEGGGLVGYVYCTSGIVNIEDSYVNVKKEWSDECAHISIAVGSANLTKGTLKCSGIWGKVQNNEAVITNMISNDLSAYKEKNCEITTKLTSDAGFSKKIWNIDNASDPYLIFTKE